MKENSNLPTQADIDEIDRQLCDLREQIAFLKERRRTTMLAAWAIEEGDVVRNTGRRFTVGILGRVTSVRPPFRLNSDRPWVMVQKQKKDGSFGGNPIHFFDDWEPTTPVAPNLAQGD